MRRGIDVSTYQGDINWAKVKADGIGFAVIKATQGRSVNNASLRNFTDSKFAQNIVGAHRYGIDVSVYHYLTAQTVSEAMAEAEYFLSVIAPYKSIISMYAVVDVEEDTYLPKDKTLLTQIVHTFCSRVKSEGYEPMVYTNPNYLTYRLNDVSMWALWLALWRDKNNVPSVKQYPNLRLWQWGQEVVTGIGGKTDANFEIVAKPAEIKEEKPKETAQKSQTSAETPSAWAEDAFSWAREKGILLGDGNGKYRPHDPLTREEACLMARRVYRAAVEDAAEAIVKKLAQALDLK